MLPSNIYIYMYIYSVRLSPAKIKCPFFLHALLLLSGMPELKVEDSSLTRKLIVLASFLLAYGGGACCKPPCLIESRIRSYKQAL